MSILKRWFEEVWNQGREATIDELADPAIHGHGLVGSNGQEIASREAFKAFYHAFRGAFPDIHVDVQDVVREGDLEVARFVVTGTHTGEGIGKPVKGRPVKITGMTMIREKDGKMVESWNNVDFLTLFQQIE